MRTGRRFFAVFWIPTHPIPIKINCKCLQWKSILLDITLYLNYLNCTAQYQTQTNLHHPLKKSKLANKFIDILKKIFIVVRNCKENILVQNHDLHVIASIKIISGAVLKYTTCTLHDTEDRKLSVARCFRWPCSDLIYIIQPQILTTICDRKSQTGTCQRVWKEKNSCLLGVSTS